LSTRPDWRVELVAVVIYAAILFRMDKAAGYRTAATWYLRASRHMAALGTWALTTSIRWENAAKELVNP
jgi:hypothetical protein